MQRLRLRFSRGPELKYISHLDLMRAWERAFRRAKLPLAYSQGFTPHPRISLAAPLPLGVTSDAEMMELYLTRWLSTQTFLSMVGAQIPPGLGISEVWIIGEQAPSLQSQVSFAGYRVGISQEISLAELKEKAGHLLKVHFGRMKLEQRSLLCLMLI